MAREKARAARAAKDRPTELFYTPADEEEPPDQGVIYRALATMHGWGPDVVDRLTMPQVQMYLPVKEKNATGSSGRIRTVGSMAEARQLTGSD